MSRVIITFHDGEVIHAGIDDLSFSLPIVSAEVQSIDPNCEIALFPLAAIRQMVIGDIETAPDPEVLNSWDRTAFHFADGQVFRAWIDPDAELGLHGGTWRVVEPDSIEMRTMGIPYSSLKGVYRLRQWDSRTTSERTGGSGGVEQLVRVLAERSQANDKPPAPDNTLINRIRPKKARR
jgi:hypothetical protein